MRHPLRTTKTNSIARLSGKIEAGEYVGQPTSAFDSVTAKVEKSRRLLIVEREGRANDRLVTAAIRICGVLEGSELAIASIYYENRVVEDEVELRKPTFEGTPEEKMRMSGLICVRNVLQDISRMDRVVDGVIVRPPQPPAPFQTGMGQFTPPLNFT